MPPLSKPAMTPSVMTVVYESGDAYSVAGIAMNMVATLVPTARTDYDDGVQVMRMEMGVLEVSGPSALPLSSRGL